MRKVLPMTNWIGAHFTYEDEPLNKAERLAPTQAEVAKHTKVIKLFADPTRLRLLAVIRLAGEICVKDLCQITGVGQTVASYHLRQLRETKAVASRKQFKLTKYSLTRNGAEYLDRVLPPDPRAQ